MTILSSLLPGLRHARTPLTAGYLWLVVIWLAFADDLPRKGSVGRGPIANLFELADLVGRPTTLAAVSLAAYVLGTVSVSFFERLPIGRLVGSKTRKKYELYVIEEIKRTARSDSGASWPSILELAEALDRDRIHVDLRTRLLNANQALYGEYDRLAAEAAFRLNVCVPSVAVGVITGHSVGWYWLSAGMFVVGSVLLAQGMVSLRQSQEVIQQAVMATSLEHPEIKEAQRLRGLEEKADKYEQSHA